MKYLRQFTFDLFLWSLMVLIFLQVSYSDRLENVLMLLCWFYIVASILVGLTAKKMLESDPTMFDGWTLKGWLYHYQSTSSFLEALALAFLGYTTTAAFYLVGMLLSKQAKNEKRKHNESLTDGGNANDK